MLLAFADVRWTIDHEPPDPSSYFRTSYNLRRTDEWRVLLCTAYEEDAGSRVQRKKSGTTT